MKVETSSCERAVLVLRHSSQCIYSALISQSLGLDSAKPPISQLIAFETLPDIKPWHPELTTTPMKMDISTPDNRLLSRFFFAERRLTLLPYRSGSVRRGLKYEPSSCFLDMTHRPADEAQMSA